MYEAPQIIQRRELTGRLTEPSGNHQGGSDAQIKHGIQPVSSYETPQITDERDLSGSTQLPSIE